MIVNKITRGFVAQTYDTEKKAFIEQKFHVGNLSDLANIADEETEHEDIANRCMHYDMVQPDAAIGTEKRVCADIARRQQVGLVKYGVTVETNPLMLREWLQHAYEETLDQAIYLKRAIEELDNSPCLPKSVAAKAAL